MKGYACFTDSSGVKSCNDVARYQCKKGCPPGEALNPMKYCECMPVPERDAMFKEKGSSSGSSSGSSYKPVSDEFQTITCPDGQTLKCFTNNKHCVDDSPVFCRGHQVKSVVKTMDMKSSYSAMKSSGGSHSHGSSPHSHG